MTTDQKIDELLRIVQGHELRFDHLEAKVATMGEDLLRLIREEAGKSEARDHELLKLIVEQREAFEEDRKSNREHFAGIENQIDGLHTKIDYVHHSLSQDINALAGDLRKLDHRVTRLEKKSLS